MAKGWTYSLPRRWARGGPAARGCARDRPGRLSPAALGARRHVATAGSRRRRRGGVPTCAQACAHRERTTVSGATHRRVDGCLTRSNPGHSGSSAGCLPCASGTRARSPLGLCARLYIPPRFLAANLRQARALGFAVMAARGEALRRRLTGFWLDERWRMNERTHVSIAVTGQEGENRSVCLAT